MSTPVDHLAGMRANLISQFQGLPNLDAFIVAVGNQLNDLEEFFGQLFTNLNLQNAVGTQLDNLGEALAQSRNGLDDSDYRTLLQARINAYQSTGSVESLIQILLSMAGASTVQVIEGGGAGGGDMTITAVGTEAAPLTRNDVVTAVYQAKPAGVLLQLNTAEIPAFQFDVTGFGIGHLAGPFA